MDLDNILIQILGFIGFGLIGLSYLAKTKPKILLWSLAGGTIVALHLFLLGGLTGALCNLIGGVALLVIYFYDKFGKKSKLPLIILVALTSAVIAWLSWDGAKSLLAIFAMTIILAAFISPKAKHLRLANIVGSALWLVYDLLVGSVSGVICEIFIITVTAIALFKYRSHTSKKPNPSTKKQLSPASKKPHTSTAAKKRKTKK